jgi:hypothetical protein
MNPLYRCRHLNSVTPSLRMKQRRHSERREESQTRESHKTIKKFLILRRRNDDITFNVAEETF